MKILKSVFALATVLLIGAAAVAQTTIPPFPTVTTANSIPIVKTLWAVAYGAQATNAAQSTQIAALQTAIDGPVVPNPVGTATPGPSATPVVTAVPSVAPATPTLAPPIATATNPPGGATVTPVPTMVMPPTAACLNCVPANTIVAVPNPAPNIRGQVCPAWAHDLWLVPAANGKLYRTWHPAIQPDTFSGAGCVFNHDHGKDDPRNSKADASLPAYGYIADLHGMTEPHNGFKTFYANTGDCNAFEGFCSTSNVKVTFHQGTSSAGRVPQRLHTLHFDLTHKSGAVVHVSGVGDTGYPGNQCAPPDQEQGTIGVRFFALPKAQANACGLGIPYEVWQWAMDVGPNRVYASLGTFDPITAFNPQTGQVERTDKTWTNGPFGGCDHDVYYGPVLLNANVDMVDAMGVRQVMKPGSVQNFPLDTVGKNVYKPEYRGCGAFAYTDN